MARSVRNDPHWSEASPIQPRSPYAAAKAAGELLVGSYVVTHGVDALITAARTRTAHTSIPRSSSR